MTGYKLTYFDIDGGRGEPVRIAFHAAGVEFEDHRISFDEFLETRVEKLLETCTPKTLQLDLLFVGRFRQRPLRLSYEGVLRTRC